MCISHFLGVMCNTVYVITAKVLYRATFDFDFIKYFFLGYILLSAPALNNGGFGFYADHSFLSTGLSTGCG